MHGTWPGGFITQVTVTNTGTTPVDGWSLDWSFTGNQGLRDSWSVEATEQGATVTARNLPWNRRIDPGHSVTFGFTGDTSLANPSPELFTLNGSACNRG